LNKPDAESRSMSAFAIVLTGGIASGKSAAAGHFVHLGVPVFDADAIARRSVARGAPALKEIAEAFGGSLLQSDGQLDRPQMRDRVFRNIEDRRRLEAILHPRVRAELVAAAEACPMPYCVLVVPLFTEFRADYAFVDRVLVLDASPETQIARLMKRDQSSREAALRILSIQAAREQRLSLADDVVDNDGELARLSTVIERLHRIYLELAETSVRRG
jgi:dephospho-CoA kinase